MSDLIDLSQIDSIALTSNILAVGAIVICVLAIFIAFIYGKMNASLEHKLKLKGTYEGKLKELQNIEIELKEKQSLKEDVEKKTARLKSEYEQFAANKEAIDQVKGQLNALGSEYQGKLQQLQDLDRELSKSEALKDFINNHQQEQLDALDQKIHDREVRLKELSEQVNEKLSGGIVKDSLSRMFSEFAENSDLKTEGQKLQQELNELRAQYDNGRAQLENLKKALNEGNIKDAINKAFTSFSVQAARAQQAQELNSKLQQLSKQVQAKTQELNELRKQYDDNRAQLQKQEKELNEGKINDVINKAFTSLNEQAANSLQAQELSSKLQQLSKQVQAKTQELNELRKQYDDNRAQLQKQEKELNEGKINDVINKAFTSLNEQAANSLQAQELRSKLQQLSQQVQAKEKALRELQAQFNEQQSSNLISEALGQAFDDLKDTLSQSMQNLASELVAQSQLTAQKTQLQQEVAALEEKAKNANTAETSDAAYEELEQPPAAIENFLEHFDSTETEDEDNALELFQDYLMGEGFFYSPRTLKAFHTSLKVQNINPISVLAGLSGTGKTQLALQYARFFNFYSEHVAVQPRWDSKDDLLGFYNFLEKRYQPTELVKALYYFHQIRNDSDSPMMMVILDEMNLARVEYYFSEFLSKMELRGNDRNYPNEKSKISIGTQLNSRDFFVGSNVVFVGTMNDDESTYSLSDKVLDRANVLHFGKPQKFEDNIHYNQVDPISISASTFNDWCNQENFPNRFPETLRTKINTLNEALDSVGKAFGYRVNKSITQYIQMYPGIKRAANREEQALVALADQIEMKIIPKLAGLEQNEKSDACLSAIGNMISNTHDAELIAAFNDAKDSYENRGMFLWRGVSRSIDQA